MLNADAYRNMTVETLRGSILGHLLDDGWVFYKARKNAVMRWNGVTKRTECLHEVELLKDGRHVKALVPHEDIGITTEYYYDEGCAEHERARQVLSVREGSDYYRYQGLHTRKDSTKSAARFKTMKADVGICVGADKDTPRVWLTDVKNSILDKYSVSDIDGASAYLHALYELRDYLQVSSYIGRMHRNAVVVDMDGVVIGGGNPGRAEYDGRALEFVKDTCLYHSLPLPSFVTVNGANGHMQLWWVFEERIRVYGKENTTEHRVYLTDTGVVGSEACFETIKDDSPSFTMRDLTADVTDGGHNNLRYREPADDHQLYNDLRCCLSFLFGGDPNATGSNYKNPFSPLAGKSGARLRPYFLCRGAYHKIKKRDDISAMIKSGAFATYTFPYLYTEARRCVSAMSEDTDMFLSGVKRAVWGAFDSGEKNYTEMDGKSVRWTCKRLVDGFRTDFGENLAGEPLFLHEPLGSSGTATDGEDGMKLPYETTMSLHERADRNSWWYDRYMDACFSEGWGRHTFIFRFSRHIAYACGFSPWSDTDHGTYLLRALRQAVERGGGKLPGTKDNDGGLTDYEILELGRQGYEKQVEHIRDGGEAPAASYTSAYSDEEKRHGQEKARRLRVGNRLAAIGTAERAGGVDFTTLSSGAMHDKESEALRRVFGCRSTVPNARAIREDIAKKGGVFSAAVLSKILTEYVKKTGYLEDRGYYRDDKTYAMAGIWNGKGKMSAVLCYPKEALETIIGHCCDRRILFSAVLKHLLVYGKQSGLTIKDDGGWDTGNLAKALSNACRKFKRDKILSKKRYSSVMSLLSRLAGHLSILPKTCASLSYTIEAPVTPMIATDNDDPPDDLPPLI